MRLGWPATDDPARRSAPADLQQPERRFVVRMGRAHTWRRLRHRILLALRNCQSASSPGDDGHRRHRHHFGARPALRVAVSFPNRDRSRPDRVAGDDRPHPADAGGLSDEHAHVTLDPCAERTARVIVLQPNKSALYSS